MFRRSSRGSEIDRRIEELEARLHQVRKSIKDVSKSGVAPAKPGALPRSRPPIGAAGPRTPAPPAAPLPSPPVAAAGPAAVPPSPPPVQGPVWRRPPHAAPQGTDMFAPEEEKRRFANYFVSGSFLGAKPLREARRFQRNRAIAMLVIVALFGWVLYRILRP